MKKCIVWVLAIVMTATLTLYASPTWAEQSDCIWVLTDVVEHDNAEKWALTNENPVYKSEYSCSQGKMSVKTTYMDKTDDNRTPPKIHGEGVRITAAFSKPPEKLYPGEKVNISVTISATDNTLSFFTFGGSANADFDNPDIMPGFRNRNAIQFTNGDGESRFEVGAKNNYGTIKQTLSATPPEGREEGDQLALRQQFYMGISMGTYYIYQWRRADQQTSEKSQESDPKSSETSSNIFDRPPIRGTIPETFALIGPPSGTGISDLYGEVFIHVWDEAGHDWYSPVLGEELPENAIIETRGNSGVILSLRDMTTFIVPANSIVAVGGQSKDESRLSILAGHIWGNVKNMIKDGSMDIEMSQGVAGIKGTTFILEDDGETSTIKVFEGTIEFTPYDQGEPVMVSGGKQLSATQYEIGKVKSFNMDAELENWTENVQEITVEAIKESKQGSPIFVLVAVLLAVIFVGGASTFIFIKSRGKKAGLMNVPYAYTQDQPPHHYSTNEQSAATSPDQNSKFCKNCGSPVAVNSKFCTGCGKQTEQPNSD